MRNLFLVLGVFLGLYPQSTFARLDLNTDTVERTVIEKNFATRPFFFEQQATECIAQVVFERIGARRVSDEGRFMDLIVDAMEPCSYLVRSFLEESNSYYGQEKGEQYFWGSYLQKLPGAVRAWIKLNYTYKKHKKNSPPVGRR